MRRWLPLIVPVLLSASIGLAEENRLENGDFEAGMAGWRPLWTRDAGAGTGGLAPAEGRGGSAGYRVRHTGEKDWSLTPESRVRVAAGELWRLSAHVRSRGPGEVVLNVTTYAAEGRVVNWVFAPAVLRGSSDGEVLESRLVVPEEVIEMQPRIIGNGPVEAWLDDVVFVQTGRIEDMRTADLPAELRFGNRTIDAVFRTEDGTLRVTDRRTGETWAQQAVDRSLLVRDARPVDGGLDVRLAHLTGGPELTLGLRMPGDEPEITVTLDGDGPIPDSLPYPHPFVSPPGMQVILPMNEGISYPVEDDTIPPWTAILYGGHGLCMAFYGITDLEQGLLTLVETPDDASVRMDRVEGRLALMPRWDPQRGAWGDTRRLRYVFLDSGGYVAMCARYRRDMQAKGNLVTLREKRAAIPATDLLVGAVNVWCWDGDAAGICRDLRSLGIERILWSHRSAPEQIRALNEMGVLSSRYDIFQDVMDPGKRDLLRGWHSDWPDKAWPADLMLDERGQWRPGWQVRAKDGSMIPCGVLCDRQAPEYARERLGEELKAHAYRSRFIDTTTASPWRECYHPDHPMTRTESRIAKMKLLGVVSGEFGLVCGSETGHDAAVPYVHYFEGMLSLGHYRVPDSGRDMMRLWDEVPDRVATFQTGHGYRLPLWELVYHDCVVAQWYWGDYNNKLPSLWDRRDLWNLLYGTPPMFMFNADVLKRYRERFASSYRTVCPAVREVGYEPMTGHRWVTPDRAVQESTFGNGTVVTVNFGATEWVAPDGKPIPPLGYRIRTMDSDRIGRAGE